MSEEVYTFAYKDYAFGHLNDIAIYFLEGNENKKKIDDLRLLNTEYLKENFDEANSTNTAEKHLNLKVQLYVIEQRTENFDKMIMLGGEKMYEIGFIRAFLDLSTGKIVLPFHYGKSMNYYGMLLYDKAVNKLIALFDVKNILEME